MSVAKKEVLRWSPTMHEVFKEHVVLPVMKGKTGENEYFGFPFTALCDEVLDWGLGDYSVDFTHDEYGTLTEDNIALCYSFVHMKRHFYEAWRNFQLGFRSAEKYRNSGRPIAFIDFGCGPATAGLAFAESTKGVPFTYVGIDRSHSLRELGRELMRAARKKGLLHPATRVRFREDWNELPLSYGKDALVIMNFSYFFASRFLDGEAIKSLAHVYRALRDNDGNQRVMIGYINSPADKANEKYFSFQRSIGQRLQSPQSAEVTYDPMSSGKGPKTETFVRAMYWLVPA